MQVLSTQLYISQGVHTHASWSQVSERLCMASSMDIFLAAAHADCPPSCPEVTEIAFAGIPSPTLSCIGGVHLFSFLLNIPPWDPLPFCGGPWGLHALSSRHSQLLLFGSWCFLLPCAYLIFTHNHKCNWDPTRLVGEWGKYRNQRAAGRTQSSWEMASMGGRLLVCSGDGPVKVHTS